MNTEQRRDMIVHLLKDAAEPVTGSEIAEKFGVSRQVIVQDVALLRALGQEIIATPQGYLFFKYDRERPLYRTFACKHFQEDTEKELNIFVDCGGVVEDVIVEHSIYGQISGSLMLRSRADVTLFCAKVEDDKAALLSSLTRGIHLHTVRADRPEVFHCIESKLAEAGILLDGGD